MKNSIKSRAQLSPRPLPFMAIVMSLVLVLVALGAPQAMSQDEEGYDMMRSITSQWVKPFIVIAFDKSGSMKWTADESDSTWNFKYSSSIQGYVNSQTDWTEGYNDTWGPYGRGQGFWMRVAEVEVVSTPPTEFQYDGYRSLNGWVDHRWLQNIYSLKSELPAGLQLGDLIRVVDYPVDGVNGIYMVAQESRSSGAHPGWWYTKFYKMNPDGTFSSSQYNFPLQNGQDVKPFTFERVKLNTDSNQLTGTGSSYKGSFQAGHCYISMTSADSRFHAGDVVKVTRFGSSRNGYYMVRRTTSDRLYLSRMNASGTFPNQDDCPSGGNDGRLYVERYLLPTEIGYSVWYFVPPSRIAIAKNVFGNEVTLYEPAISRSGNDDRSKPYYIFDGAGPVNGAWKEWRGSGDNASGGVWHNWHNTDGHEPEGDPSYTTKIAPSDIVSKLGDVADLGLVYYPKKYWCNSGEPAAVDIDPDDSDQADEQDELHRYFRLLAPVDQNGNFHRENGGLAPGGGTPTRAALRGAKNALKKAFNHDTKQACGRSYGVILLTDGQSNRCNTDKNYCWKDPWTGVCDADSGYTCPGHWDVYPAGVADELWKIGETEGLWVNGEPIHARTWAVGLSQGIGPCELNYTAYKGRTDASSPNNDAGFDISQDSYLTEDDNDVFDTEVLDPTDGDPGHGPYAYFATTVDELREALLDIISSMGVGDYTTSAPAVSGSVTGAGLLGIVASSDYPEWKGHLRAFNRDASAGEWMEVWDAGAVLSSTNNGVSRKIYTWDDQSNLIEVTASNATDIDLACGNCGVDAAVIDFIRGNDGNGNARPWKLGALINSTPAVIGPPARWKQGPVQNHVHFETTYANRHSLVWVGSSDGMIHAFDTVDGAEILALLPPDLLENEIRLYSQYLMDPSTYVTGQKKPPSNHIYGVANSIRFADVGSSSSMKTIIFITEGPGGRAVHGIDVTHPYPGRTIGDDQISADPNYDSSKPVRVLWSRIGGEKTGEDPDLGVTWSIPSVGIDEIDHNANGFSKLFLGRGYLENSENQNNPAIMFLDPVTGALQQKLYLQNSSSPLVGNQAFADSSIWQKTADTFHPDNLVDEAIQVDLNGVVWSITGNGWQSRDSLFDLGGDQPLYYSPALGSYPAPIPDYDLFVFGSGTYYEVSEKITGSRGSFVPTLYVGVRKLEDDTVNLKSIAITDIKLPEDYEPPVADMDAFSARAQVIASPILLTPAEGSDLMPISYFLVYDPLAGECVGESFIVEVGFDPDDILTNGENADVDLAAYDAGQGTAGGIGCAGTKVIVSQSAVGEGGKAHIVEVPNLTIPVGTTGADNVRWWMELQ